MKGVILVTLTALRSGLSLDAPHLLGLGPASNEPLPTAEPGTIILRYCGWSLQQLRDKRIDLMHRQNWYNEYRWSVDVLPSGIYVLRLPVPKSNRKSFDEQKALLLPGEETASVVLAATALLAIRLSGEEEPLHRDWVRCNEQTASGRRVVLDWDVGRLDVSSHWSDRRFGYFWLAAARTS